MPHRLWLMAAALAWAGTLAAQPLAAPGIVAAAPAFNAVWAGQPQYLDQPLASVRIVAPAEQDAGAAYPLRCEVDAANDLGPVQVQLEIFNAQEQRVELGTLMLEASRGINRAEFYWKAGSTPAGRYTAVVTVTFAETMAPAKAMLPLLHVTGAHLATLLDEIRTQLSAHRGRLDDLSAQTGATPPYLHMRLALAEQAASDALRAMDRGDWREAAQYTSYADDATRRLAIAFTFERAVEEPMPFGLPPLAPVAPAPAGASFEQAGRAIFPVGLEASGSVERAARLAADLHLDLLVTGLADAGTALREAGASHLPLHLRAQTDDLNLATDAARGQFREQLRSLNQLLTTGTAPVMGLSLAAAPRVEFDPAALEPGFVEYVQQIYPDRHELNRAWRAHLASFDEIKLAYEGDTPPLYHEKRPFRWEYQSFYRDVVNRYFEWARTTAREAGLMLPLQVDLAQSAFATGESRTGLHREALARYTEVSGLSVDVPLAHEFYAYAYPLAEAHYTLSAATAPNQPVFNTRMGIDFAAVDVALHQRLAHSIVWQGIMSGADALALAYSETAPPTPQALEGLATASLDLRRLAPIVRAFHEAPIDVAVLWSDSAKIFDDGDPYLSSAFDAYEGVSFGGYKVGFVSEVQAAAGALENVRLLVIPETPALRDDAFDAIKAYLARDGAVARVGTPIPYNERGASRLDLIQSTATTVLVRGLNLPTEYLHAIDAQVNSGALPEVPRAINASGYPLEGVITRYVRFQETPYLYVLSVRKDATNCVLTGGRQAGVDLISGEAVEFPRMIEPLVPMLVQLEDVEAEVVLTATAPVPPREEQPEKRRGIR